MCIDYQKLSTHYHELSGRRDNSCTSGLSYNASEQLSQMLKEFFVGDFYISKIYVCVLSPRVALLKQTYLPHCLTMCSTGVFYR